MTFTSKVHASTIAMVSAVLGFGCAADQTGNQTDNTSGDTSSGAAATCGTNASCFTRLDLVSDVAGRAQRVDPDLVNGWGIAPANGWFYIADEGTGKVSIYDGAGVAAKTPVASGALNLGVGITGVAVNDSNAFKIHSSTLCGAARLIYASLGGTLIAVNSDVDAMRGQVVVDRSSVGAVYTGVTIVQSAMGMLILAADFHNARIDVFDTNFALVTNVSMDASKATFSDQTLPAGYAPFNVMAIKDTVYIAYAKVDSTTGDEAKGPGLGFVSAFDSKGTLLWNVSSDLLNAPWGMAIAPSDFGKTFANALIVGNFGDGRLVAIDASSHEVLGLLQEKSGRAIVIDGLWGIAFGTTWTNDAATNALYFASGPNEEMHGLFGVLASCEVQ